MRVSPCSAFVFRHPIHLRTATLLHHVTPTLRVSSCSEWRQLKLSLSRGTRDVSDRATKLRSSRDFETPRECASSLPSMWGFDMTSSTRKRKFLTWPQEKTDTSTMNSRRSLSHVSRVNEPVVRSSASWCLGVNVCY